VEGKDGKEGKMEEKGKGGKRGKGRGWRMVKDPALNGCDGLTMPLL
jgi:hypothetical protein